jgi:D-arginine dehydrogenase
MTGQAESVDFIVIGAGMAGASAAWGLARLGRTVLLERESQPGYHSTGRSAALFTEGYGNAAMRALTRAGRSFFEAPPAEFTSAPFLTRRGVLTFSPPEHEAAFSKEYADLAAKLPKTKILTPARAREKFPLLKVDRNPLAFFEPDAVDLDVHAIHQGFLRGFKASGGVLHTYSEVTGIASGWEIEVSDGRKWRAPVLVNAAGAWVDVIAEIAGVKKIGLVPKRRTAILFEPPAGHHLEPWPMANDMAETVYVKPDAGKLLASPADETPSEPTDAQPEELDVAIVIDRMETEFDVTVGRPSHRWAGLRSFVKDKTIVAGFAPGAPGFFFVGGQGGYGIQTSAAMAGVVSGLIRDDTLPDFVASEGVTKEDLSPNRAALA